MNDDVVRRARALIGVRFRPQGRSVEAGLDCIGVVAMAFGLTGVRSDYRLRASKADEVNRAFYDGGFEPISATEAGPGDVLVVQAGFRQLHVVILTPDGYLHGDAGLRRVAEVPGTVGWPVLRAWRASVGTDGNSDPHLPPAADPSSPANAGEG